ncbi:hypothetical protein AB0M54_06240 [Actinoplanes sp. NPDC051470]|uniref:hypothetical protein n=1 Tax=Actinoplanes sp. NPDC051470 TaxID=3157224 RepID=UPI003421E9F3
MPGRVRRPDPLSTHEPAEEAGRRPAPSGGLAMLQQTAGNRAVAALVAQRAPAAAQAPVAGPQAPAPWWPQGPTVARKQNSTPLAQYVAWVKEVEAAYPGKAEVIHRLRRLYYSNFVAGAPGGAKGMNPSGTAGPKFDKAIDGDDAVVPMTSPPVSQAALNGLFATDNVVTPAGETLDPAHFLPALDLALQGASTLGGGLQEVSGAPLTGVFTWTGDLASWFVDWSDHKKKNPAANDIALLNARMNSKVSMEDLLSDMDAQIMVKSEVAVNDHWQDGGSPDFPGTMVRDRSLNRPLSDILQSFYGTPAGQPARPNVPNRFARFVQAAVPAIPYRIPDPTKPHEVRLAADARKAIHAALYAAAEALFEGSNIITRPGTPDALDDYPHILTEITRRFHEYLEKGLANGSAPWP